MADPSPDKNDSTSAASATTTPRADNDGEEFRAMPRVDPAAQSMAQWFEKHCVVETLEHVFRPLPVGSNVFFQRDVHCIMPWQRAVITEHVTQAGSSLHYKVSLLEQGGMALVVEHFRVAPLVVRVRLSELDSAAAAGKMPRLGAWKDVGDASRVRWGGVLPVSVHLDSKQMTVLWLNHFGRETFEPFAVVEYDPARVLHSKRYDVLIDSFDRCVHQCPKRFGTGVNYFVDTSLAGQPRVLQDALIAAYHPVADEYAIVLPTGAAATRPHSDKLAFTAMTRLANAVEDTGATAISKNDKEVLVRIETSAGATARTPNAAGSKTPEAPARDAPTLLELPVHLVQIQPWVAARLLTKREDRMSHNCSVM